MIKLFVVLLITSIGSASIGSAFTGSAFSQGVWERTADFPGGQQRVFALTRTNSGAIIAESRGSGIYRSTNSGTSWTLVSTAEIQIACLSTAPNGNIYALYTVPYTSINISRSTDDGISWNRVYTRSTPNNFYAVGGIAFLSNGHIAAAMERIVGQFVSNSASLVLRSTNSGLNWNIAFDDSSLSSGTLKDFRTVNDTIFSSYSTGIGLVCPVFYSADEGSSWHAPSSFTSFGYCLEVDRTQGNKLYAGIWTGDNVTEKLYVSPNRGAGWVPGGLQGGNIYTIFAASNGHIYAATDYSASPWAPKIKRSTDHGQSWESFMDGMPLGLRTYAFTENAAGDIFAGTTVSLTNIPGGVFILRNPIGIHSNNEEIPENYSLGQNYPNPFNPSTNFEFNIAELGFVNIVIFDALGRKVETLVNGELKAGVYNARWDASRYPSGVYFYKLSVGGFTQTRKMILTK